MTELTCLDSKGQSDRVLATLMRKAIPNHFDHKDLAWLTPGVFLENITGLVVRLGSEPPPHFWFPFLAAMLLGKSPGYLGGKLFLGDCVSHN